jgi:hypothetical protein
MDSHGRRGFLQVEKLVMKYCGSLIDWDHVETTYFRICAVLGMGVASSLKMSQKFAGV